ncbi:MAG: glycine cleavage system aminomethyltransferase GcvT [Armatimonadetes bacterium]|nr:glycine cleavage system aminomethyltransferase GcvT [Armatimonadota bacterium]MDW8152790.1 glycine cleavage system aminomethyltransferase GcvT [Armatimonadota bacterium]
MREGQLARTPLYAHHLQLGARMVAFAGWEMPLQYRGIVAEHRAVRTSCGLFDVSHMGVFWVLGPRALEDLSRLLANDPRRLRNGQALYTPMCNEAGGMVDDLVVFRFAADRFLMVGNAARREADLAWLHAHAASEVVDATEELALLAVQGPRAEQALQPLVATDLSAVRRYWFVPGTAVAGVPAIVSRTGYTGEDGFEVFCPWDQAAPVWEALLETGAVPCGLGARDTLRLEAGYLLYGQDAGEHTSPLEAGLDWAVKLEGRAFIGAQALRGLREVGVSRRLCGLVVEDRVIARRGCRIRKDGEPVGEVTSGTWGPWVERSIALGYLRADLAGPGTPVAVEVRTRTVHAEVVRLPFYRRVA